MSSPPRVPCLLRSAASAMLLLGAWSCATEDGQPVDAALMPPTAGVGLSQGATRAEPADVAGSGSPSAGTGGVVTPAVVPPPPGEVAPNALPSSAVPPRREVVGAPGALAGSSSGGAASLGPERSSGGMGGLRAEVAPAASGEAGEAGLGGGPPEPSSQGVEGHAGASAAGSASVGGAGPVGGGTSPPEYLLGADLSIILQDEHWGATYTEAGQQQDVVQLLAQHGFNYARLRTFVDPAAPGGYAAGEPEAFNDLAHTIEMGQRVKSAGMGLLVDFHYSDTWADPLNQTVPQAWAGLGIDQLEMALYDYTRASLEALVAQGAAPGMVQVGNETTAAMAGVERAAGDSFARLFAAGSRAVRDVDASMLIVLHIERCHDLATSRSWLNDMAAAQVDFDVLAQSCYGDVTGQNGEAIAGYHGSVGDWDSTFRTLAAEYPDLRFIAAEYSSDKRAINDVLRSLPDGRGLGTFLWGTTRWYETHPVEPLFTPGSVWSDFIVRPDVMDLYDQMTLEYGLR